jgi:hypothetical protein
MFNEMRAVRNDSVYEPHHDAAEIAERLVEARVSMPGSLVALRTAIIRVRPGLAARLPHIR